MRGLHRGAISGRTVQAWLWDSSKRMRAAAGRVGIPIRVAWQSL